MDGLSGSLAKEKLDEFVLEYDCSRFDKLPKFLKTRINALKKLQLEQVEIQYQYHKQLQELELKYDKLFQPLYDKRAKIISGEYEPTEEECQLPANIVDNEYNGDQENKDESDEDDDDDYEPFTEEHEKVLEKDVKGVPGFWLGCLQSTFNFIEAIQDYDKTVLKHLMDIKLSYDLQEDMLKYTLEFVFEKNSFFSNEVLTKTYYLKLKPDEKDPFSYDGFVVVKSEGCKIDWNPGQNITVETKMIKQKNKNDGRVREKPRECERDSFFYFFQPPEVPKEDDDVKEDIAAMLSVDFELGEILRLSMIPKAALYYTGLMKDDDDDDDDEEDFDDLDDEEDSDSDESNDSLNSANAKEAPKKSLKSEEGKRKS